MTVDLIEKLNDLTMQDNVIFSMGSGFETHQGHLTTIRAVISSMILTIAWRMGGLTPNTFTGDGNHGIVTYLLLILWCSWTPCGTNLGHSLVTQFFVIRCNRWFAWCPRCITTYMGLKFLMNYFDTTSILQKIAAICIFP